MKRVLTSVIGAVAVATTSAVFASITTVSPSNMGNWTFYTLGSGGLNTGSGAYGMEIGPGTPPLGTGSAYMTTPTSAGDEGVQLRSSGFVGTKLSDLTTLSYSTYASASNATPPDASQDTFFVLYVDTDGVAGYDDRLFFEPTYSSAGAGNGNPSPQADPVLNQWQNWNLLTGMWYDDNATLASGPGSNAKTWSDLIGALPTGTAITSDDGNGAGGIRISIGQASASDNFDVNVDNFIVGVSGTDTTYDFEPDSAGVVPEAPAIAIWGLLSLVTAGGCYTQHKRTVLR